MKKLIITVFVFSFFNIAFIINISNAQWITTSNGITGGASIRSLAVSGSNIFAGATGEGVYLSTNYGSSWVTVNNGLTQLAVYALTFSGSTLFAGTLDGVFKSTNNGADWTLSNTGIVGFISSFAVSGTSIYAGGNGGIFLSVNNGANWTELLNGLPDNFAATALMVSNSGVFAGQDNTGTGVPGGIYKSTNGGTNWNLAVNGLINGNVRCLAASASALFAGTAAGVYVSTNDGNNWSPVNEGLPGLLYINTIFTSGSNVFIGTNPPGQLYMTTNNGANWIDKSLGFTGPQYVYSINTANGYIFAGKYHSVWRRQYSEIIGIHNISSIVPEKYSLSQNYPNPFNPSTKIKFDVASKSNVLISVYDVNGREIQNLVNETLSPGTYEAVFESADLNSGVYFYKFSAGNYSETKRMILIK